MCLRTVLATFTAGLAVATRLAAAGPANARQTRTDGADGATRTDGADGATRTDGADGATRPDSADRSSPSRTRFSTTSRAW
ncbi:hypothetical protein ABZ092_13450 [Streptomyces bobili]|uniref:hypothetical protein n=1 Tax=Streptomyces bobili TaxID=67280 RepID=UPI0033BC7921